MQLRDNHLLVLSRYRELMRGMLSAGLTTFVMPDQAEGFTLIERGMVFPRAVMGMNTAGTLPDFGSIVDRAGHRRAVYLPLLVHAHLEAERLMPETGGGGAPAAKAKQIFAGFVPDGLPTAAWFALVQLDAGDTHGAAGIISNLLDRQQSSGAFLPLEPGENPETNWFDELVLLHAVSVYAVKTHDAEAMTAVQRAAAYHMEETQPDHASNQPWGVLAFLLNPQTIPLADQVLHAAGMSGALGAVSTMLIADAVVGIDELLAR